MTNLGKTSWIVKVGCNVGAIEAGPDIILTGEVEATAKVVLEVVEHAPEHVLVLWGGRVTHLRDLQMATLRQNDDDLVIFQGLFCRKA